MADEKTLFNKNTDNEDKKHPIMKEEDADFVDFSAAFDGEDDEDESLEEFDEEFERSRSVFPLRMGIPFLRRKKEIDDFSPVEEEEEKSSVKEEKEEKKNKKNKKNKKEKPSVLVEEKSESQETVDFEASFSDAEEDEETVEEKISDKKKGFSLFIKKKKETEIPVEEEIETEKIAELPTEQDSTEDFSENDQESEDADEEIIIVLDDDDDEGSDEQAFVEDVQEEKVEIVEKQEEIEELPPFEKTVETVELAKIEFEEDAEEKETEEAIEEKEVEESAEKIEAVEVVEEKSEKKNTRFSFLGKRQKEKTASKEITEEIAEPVSGELEIELLPSFEETEKTEEKSEEVTTEVESVVEEIPEESEIKEIPPFEEAVSENEVTIPMIEETEEAKPEKKRKKKKEKAVKPEAEAGEKPAVEPMTMKDHMTFILIILALLMTIAFIVLKFIPLGGNEQQTVVTDVTKNENISEIEICRKGITGHLIQSDIENVFYTFSQDGSLTLYQSNNNGMKEIKPTGSVNAVADVNNEKISVKVDYLEIEGELFGTGLFRKTDGQGNYLHDMVVFKLVNLPEGYVGEGKALLLATSNSEAISQSCNVWENSFVVDLETGKTTKFISNNGNMYLSYSILTNEGYASANGKIPFFTTRDYDATTNKKDIYLKSGNKETSFAKDVAGSFVYVNGDTVTYLKNTEKGFDVVRNGNDKETLIFSLDGNSSYLYHGKYLLDKYNGIIYNVETGRKIDITGYGMSNPEMMTVSDDGKYLVVLGTVNSAIDYQVHIFDLEKNEYVKYVDDNFSNHENLVFVGNSTIVYSAVEPKQGCEYVMVDVSKAFK